MPGIGVRRERHRRFAAVIQQLVYLVSQDQETGLPCQFDQACATRFCQGMSGWVLMNRDRVEKFRFAAFQLLFKGFDDQPILIGGDGDDLQIVIRKDFEREKITWFFDKNRIARFCEERAEQIQAVGDARGDEKVFRVGCEAVSPAEKFRKRETEISIALFDAIL